MQAKPLRVLIGAAGLAMAAVAVQATEPPPSTSPQARAATPAVHLAIGQVVDFDVQQRLLTVAHQDIPSLGMPAMTMDFPVHPAADSTGIAAGKTVALVLAMVDGRLTATALQAVDRVPGDAAPAAGASAMTGHPMKPGSGMSMMAACHEMMHGR